MFRTLLVFPMCLKAIRVISPCMICKLSDHLHQVVVLLLMYKESFMSEISIIVPVYNVEKYLARCLESIINQTYQNLEIICVNDGSTDNSLQILNNYAAKDKRIIVINQENKGLSAARNAGLKRAGGTYVSFIDSDDFVHPQFVEILLYLIKQNQADISVARILKNKTQKNIIPETINKANIHAKIESNPLFSILSHQRYRLRFMVCPALYKTSLIVNHLFIEGIYFEDYPWIISLMSQNPKTVITNQQLYYYTYNPGSITKTAFTVKKANDYWTGLKYLLEHFKQNKQGLSFLKKRLVPNIFKTQLKLIEKETKKDDLYSVLADELYWAKKEKLLSIWHNNWFRLRKYHKIMNNKHS